MLTVERTGETLSIPGIAVPECMKEILAEIAAREAKEITETMTITGEQTVEVCLSHIQKQDGVAVLKSEVAPGFGEAPHVRSTEDRIVHIVRGTFWVRIGGEMRTARAGDTLSIPRGVVHAWRQVSHEGGAYVTLVLPA
jgi:quercetin dioxygenase-like cupin family protein